MMSAVCVVRGAIPPAEDDTRIWRSRSISKQQKIDLPPIDFQTKEKRKMRPPSCNEGKVVLGLVRPVVARR
jgi:hypothetical protein